MAGLLFTIDGFEYALGTAGLTSLPTSSDTDFPSDTTLLSAALAWPRQTITERCRPLDGDVDVSGMSFDVFDVTPSSGSASGHPVFTYLGTRGTISQTSTLLDDALSDSETGTVTVLSSASFAASGTIWIDREAIGYASKASGTSFDTLTRGKYGSKAAFHVYEPDFSYASTVYVGFPGFEGRRCVLWLVDGSNVATCLWIGRIRNGPRLGGSGAAEGAMYQFQCDHIWQSERELRLGADVASCSVSGFDPSEIKAQITYPGAPFVTSSVARGTVQMRATLDEALNDVRVALGEVITTLGVDITVDTLAVTADGIAFEATTNVGQATTAVLTVGGQSASAPAAENSDRRHPRVAFAPIPSGLAKIYSGASSTIPVDDASKLPASWANVTTTTSPHTTTVRNVLVGDYDKDLLLVFEPTSADTSVSPHTVTGYGFLVPLSRDAIGAANAGTIHLDRDITLRACPRVTTTHWLYGLRYGLATDSSVFSTGLDSRNWDWTGHRRAIGLADSVQPDRVWYLDGRRTVADLARTNVVLDGVALGIRNGRVSPFALTPPMASDTPVATFTSGNFTRRASWERNPDGIANVFEVQSGNVRSVTNNQLSVARYGQGKAIKLTLDGSDDARLPRADPRELSSSVLAHLNNFAEPTFVRRINVGLSYATSVWIGDYVSVTDWLTPDGEGGRGPSGIVGQVIGREINLSPGAGAGVTLEVLSYWQGLLEGISPCCRVSSIVGDVLNINVGYLAGTSSMSDYADSTGDTYPFLFGDGGASWFTVGDRVKLVQRGVTTVTEETGFTVTNVSPGAGTSTIEVSPAPTTVVGGNVWDVVFDNYDDGSLVTDYEKKFAWNGDYANDVIGTSSDNATRWAP